MGAQIFTDCKGGNPVAAQGVGGNVPLVAVDLGPELKEHVALDRMSWSIKSV